MRTLSDSETDNQTDKKMGCVGLCGGDHNVQTDEDIIPTGFHVMFSVSVNGTLLSDYFPSLKLDDSFEVDPGFSQGKITHWC